MTFASVALAAALMLSMLVLAGCTSQRETSPGRTATEQLLISKAADEAAERLSLPIPAGSRIYVDASSVEGADGRYAVAAIRDRLLRLGGRMAASRLEADIVVEVRAGALSIDDEQTLLGIPRFDIPMPLVGNLTFPEIALYKAEERRGIAKFAATAYDVGDGALVGASEPQYGYAHRRRWRVLLFFSSSTDDLIPEEQRDQ